MKKFHKKLIPYLFISPFFIGYAIFFAYPVFQSLKLELQQALDKIATPEAKKEEPVKKKPVPTFTSGTVKEVEEKQPEAKKKPKPMIKAPKPKGYNIEVDGPREVIPNPKFIEAEAKIN